MHIRLTYMIDIGVQLRPALPNSRGAEVRDCQSALYYSTLALPPWPEAIKYGHNVQIQAGKLSFWLVHPPHTRTKSHAIYKNTPVNKPLLRVLRRNWCAITY